MKRLMVTVTDMTVPSEHGTARTTSISMDDRDELASEIGIAARRMALSILSEIPIVMVADDEEEPE